MKQSKKSLLTIAAVMLATVSITTAQNTSTGFSDTAFIRKNIADNQMEIQMAENGRDKGSSDVKKVAREMISDHSQILADLRKVASKQGMKDVFADPGTGNNVAPTATPDTTTVANGNGITGSKPTIPAGATVAGTASTTVDGTSSGSTATSSNTGSGVGTSTSRGSTTSMSGQMATDNMNATSEAEFSKMWVSQMVVKHKEKLNELQSAARQVKDPELLSAINKAIPKVTMHLDMLSKLK